MAFDREASLKRAEKFLRQGRLEGAIEEYLHLLEELPNDWNSRNALGDLYVRARQVDEAAAQFTRIADHFAQEGFLPRAIALYKKVIKIKPDDEHALLQSADVNAQQGLLADAKASLATVVDQRRRKGDAAGANQIIIKIGTVDPNDLTARGNAARAAADLGDTAGAAARYKELAAELFERDRASEAIDALAQAIQLDPSDADARDSLVAGYLKRGEAAQARSAATNAAHFKAIGEYLLAHGEEEQALEAFAEAVQHDPSDVATRTAVVRRLLARGQADRAAEFVAPDALADDPDLMLLAAEVDLRLGRKDAARQVIHSLVEVDRGRCESIVALGSMLAETDADAGFECVDVATGMMTATRDWQAAANALQAFTRVAPLHIPALMKLVDVCVDGDLDSPGFAAEAQLAEAYMAAGRSFEARVIAEDLVARVPGDPVNVDRFRRALVLAGEPDPESVIADRLSADAALALEDLNEEQPPAQADAAVASPLAGRLQVVAADATSMSTFAGYGDLEARAAAAVQSALSGPQWPGQEPAALGGDNGHDAGYGVDTTLEETKAEAGAERVAAPSALAAGEFDEIDLSGVLGDMHAGQTASRPGTRGLASPGSTEPGWELDEVFEEFRQEVLREQVSTTAGQHYKLALTYHDMGMTEECMKALEVASKSPRYRFHAAVLLGRMYRQQGKLAEAIDWFERAAETPAPSVGASRALLYELARGLEDEGESVRALAVYLELQAEAGDYRDIGKRIEALSN